MKRIFATKNQAEARERLTNTFIFKAICSERLIRVVPNAASVNQLTGIMLAEQDSRHSALAISILI